MKSNRARSKQSGYVLLAVLLTMTLMLIALSIAAPRIAQQIKRDKEEELIHRGEDYAIAVKRFVHKNGGRYPNSVEQLENTNHIRFLRKKYVDPMTGDSDWKMVHVGEAQIKIPAPNPGLSGGGGTNPGLGGSTAGTTGGIGGQTGNTGGSLTGGSGLQTGNTGTLTGGTGGLTGGQSGNAGNLGSLTTSNIGNGQTVGGGQIMGVASVSKKHSIKEFNDKDEYDEWYFVYDLRLEQSGGSGVTVAAPRIGGSSTGTAAGAGNAGGSGTSAGTSGTSGATGSQNPPGNLEQTVQPAPTATPTPPPQVPN